MSKCVKFLEHSFGNSLVYITPSFAKPDLFSGNILISSIFYTCFQQGYFNLDVKLINLALPQVNRSD